MTTDVQLAKFIVATIRGETPPPPPRPERPAVRLAKFIREKCEIKP